MGGNIFNFKIGIQVTKQRIIHVFLLASVCLVFAYDFSLSVLTEGARDLIEWYSVS